MLPRTLLRRAFGVGLIGLLASLSIESRAVDGPRGEDDARREVERLLVESDRARKRVDFGAARSLAAQAVELAGRSLPQDDPAQTRTKMVHFGRLYDEAIDKKQFGRALESAGTAAFFAAERSDFRSALQWTQVAREVAVAHLKLKPGNPGLKNIDLAEVEFQAREANLSGDRERVHASGKRAEEFARASFPPGDPNRDRLLVMFAMIKSWRGDDAAARKLCDEVEEATRHRPAGNEYNRVEALLLVAGLVAMGDEPIPAENAPRLAEALRRAFGDKVDERCETEARAIFWTRRLARAREERAGGAATGTVEDRFARDLGRFESILRDARVAPAVAAMGGNFLALFQLLEQRIAAAEETLSKMEWAIQNAKVTPLAVGEYWINRGAVEIVRANYDAAREDFERANRLELTPVLRAQALNNLGDLLIKQGDYPAAVDRLKAAIALDPGQALALRNLADASERFGQLEEAARLRRRAIAIAESSNPPVPYALYLCRNSLGNGEYKAGNLAAARIEFEKSREIGLKAFGADHYRVAEADVTLGWIAMAEGRLDVAAETFGKSLKVFGDSLGQEHPRTAECLSYLAQVHAAQGRGEQARAELESALSLRERTLDRILRSAFSERDRLALVQELRVHPEASAWPGVLDTYLDLATSLGIGPTEQYRRILAWKGVLARHAPPRVDELEDDPEVRRLALERERLLPRLRDASFLDARGEQARTLEAEVDALERRLRERSRRFASGVGPTVLGPDEVAAALPPSTALLDVIEIRRYRPRKPGEPHKESLRYAAMLVRGDRPVIAIDLGDAAQLDDRMKVFLEQVSARVDTAATGEALGRAIRTPLVPHLEGIEALIVSADGLLGRLPLGALPGRRPGTYWVDDLAFASTPSAHSLVARRRRNDQAGSGALIVGGVDYGATQTASMPGTSHDRLTSNRGPTRSRLITRWPPLSETLIEAETVARAYRENHPGEEVKLLSGDLATKEALRRQMAGRRLIHLATHGLFDAGRESAGAFDTLGTSAQFDSYLVLAGANRGAVDALLTAEEVGRLDLRGVDLVVLSACQSGLGHIRAGQGDVGLLGAFDRAGAKALVSTLWEVGDAATNALMQSFYRHLASAAGRKGPAWALRAAQRDMIRGTLVSRDGASFARPTDWAAFVLSGDPAVPVRP